MDFRKLNRAIAGKLRAARMAAKPPISQADMAIILGMTRGGVANMEGGKQRILIEHLYNAAAACKVTVPSLLP